MGHTLTIEDKLKKMPPDLQREVLDYVDFLLQKTKLKENTNQDFKFDWEGGLLELKNKFTSVQLQHKALEWR